MSRSKDKAEDAVEPVEGTEPPVDTRAEPDASEDPAEPSTGSTDDPVDRAVRAWVAGHIAGGPIARNTDCWNALQAALPALRKSIISSQLQEG